MLKLGRPCAWATTARESRLCSAAQRFQTLSTEGVESMRTPSRSNKSALHRIAADWHPRESSFGGVDSLEFIGDAFVTLPLLSILSMFCACRNRQVAFRACIHCHGIFAYLARWAVIREPFNRFQPPVSPCFQQTRDFASSPNQESVTPGCPRLAKPVEYFR